MEDQMAYVYGEYIVQFTKDGHTIRAEATYPGEVTPAGTLTGHLYCYSNPEDTSHTKDDSLHIDILRVQTGHDKKGIGTFLMKKLMSDFVDQYKLKHVTTTPSPTGRISMQNLRKFYMKFKFGPAFLPKKIEFVDEDYLLSDVLDKNIEQNKKNKVTEGIGAVTDTIGAFITQSEKNVSSNPMNQDQHEKLAKSTKASKVGFQTVIHFLDECLRSKNNIIQVGASGASIYGTYLAKKGHNVKIIEPDYDEVEIIKLRTRDVPRISVINDTYDSLEDYEEDSQDAILCFGPMYAPISLEAKKKVIDECLRVCKPGGAVFISFLMNEMLVMEKTFNEDYDFLSGPKFDPVTLKVINQRQRMLSFDEIEVLFKMVGMKYVCRFAAEGISLLIRDKMEDMTEKQFNKWMEFHYKVCKNREMLGCSKHVVYVLKKPDAPKKEEDDAPKPTTDKKDIPKPVTAAKKVETAAGKEDATESVTEVKKEDTEEK